MNHTAYGGGLLVGAGRPNRDSRAVVRARSGSVGSGALARAHDGIDAIVHLVPVGGLVDLEPVQAVVSRVQLARLEILGAVDPQIAALGGLAAGALDPPAVGDADGAGIAAGGQAHDGGGCEGRSRRPSGAHGGRVAWPPRPGRVIEEVVSSAMVLCAGYGTRLRPLTDELPKPLVPVGDRSILAHIAGRLEAAGFDRMLINLHHLKNEFIRHINDLPIDVHAIAEPVIRGTAGGVAGARELLEAPVLVHNGDILADPPMSDLMTRAKQVGFALAVAPRPSGEGTLGLGDRGQVVRLRGKTHGVEVSGADYIGVCAIGSTVLAALPEQGCLIGDVALPRLEGGETIATCATPGPWADLGDPARYHALNMAWLTSRSLDSYVAPGAEVPSGVTLRSCIIGSEAHVAGRGRLERCVVWPGATVRAPLSDAVVTTNGVVVAVDSRC